MSLNETAIEGTIQPDGTLLLDEKPNLPTGRVKVLLRQESESPTPLRENWWQFMQNMRTKMQEAGCPFMDEQEMQAHIQWLREGDRIDDFLQEPSRQDG